MFANETTSIGISQRVVATLVACAVVLMSIGIYTQTAQAASLAYISDTLSDSAPSATAAHTIEYTLATTSSGLGAGATTTVTFESFTTVNAIGSGDVTVTVNGTPDAINGYYQTGQSISFNGIVAAAGDDIVVAIAAGNVTNPAGTGSYDISIDTGTAGDSGKAMVAIVNTVLVEAIVDTTFTFTVTGVATSSTVNGNTTTGSTSPTSINYGNVVAGAAEVLAQRLGVATNAKNGFVVTVESDGQLESANGADIDNFDDGVEVTAPGTTWSTPNININQENTWGHWGLTTTDANIGTNDGYYGGTNFGSNEFIAASTSPRAVFAHTGPADNSTNYMGSTTVAYKLEITALQEAADDYQAVLTYIATPTF